jgi:signal transduction histidine kinase
MLTGNPFYRRAIPIYLATIILPVAALLWLGLESFERQRQSLLALTAEKLQVAVEAETRNAARTAFLDRPQPIAKYFFTFEGGAVVDPVLQAPAPLDAPPAFGEGEREELDRYRLDLALRAYRRLLRNRSTEPLALSRVARVLSKLGREAEARSTWRELAAKYPDARDLSGRPFGIVAAINAGDTAGIAEEITKDRWKLSRDQAEFFLSRTSGAAGASAYLDRYRFAETLNSRFRPRRELRNGEIDSSNFDGHRVFYQAVGFDRIEAFLVNPAWASALRERKAREVGLGEVGPPEIVIYAGALTMVLVVLSAGAVLLWRDVARETRTNRLRSDFVSGVSHDLKTPITLVRLYADTLLRHQGLSEDEQREFYRIIARESTRLGRLVDQILSFARVERGAEEYELQDGDIGALVSAVVDDYGEWLEHAGFVVTRTIPGELPSIRFDPAAVAQALVNLLENAAKYSASGRNIDVRLEATDDHVIVEVLDQGMGICSADRARIFERFYRAAKASGKGGSGLGLFMVRHIMHAHGGRAEVESEPGRGSVFRLIFPIAS